LRTLPQPEVVFNYLGQFGQERSRFAMFSPASEDRGPIHSLRQTRKHLLDVNGSVAAGQLKMHWTYSRNIHRRDTIEALANGFILALQSLIAHCQFPERVGYIPSDFPLARLDQQTLDRLAAQLNRLDSSGE
jgi:non-ribosomal peptide synthase protein (TIGR01720 family)